MSTFGDHGSDMVPTWLLDDDIIESIMRGDDVEPRLEPLAAFARQVRALGDGEVTPACPAVWAVIAGAGGSGRKTTGRPRMLAERVTTAAGRSAGFGRAAKLGLGAAVGVVSMAGAAAAGVLPDRADDAVRGAIEAVTPVEFTKPAHEHPANFGERVSSDATGQSDGEHGVDGSEISDEAPGAAHRPSGHTPGAPTDKGASSAARDLTGREPGSEGTELEAPGAESPSTPSSVPSEVPDSGGASGDQGAPDAPPGPPATHS